MIQINDKLRIVKDDERNLKLEHLKIVKGKDGIDRQEWLREGYYSDLKSAFKGALKKCFFDIAEDENVTLIYLIEKMNYIEKNIVNAITQKEKNNG